MFGGVSDRRDTLSDRGVAISSRSTLCMYLIRFSKPARGLRAPQLWLSRSPTTLQAYCLIQIFELKSQILRTVFLQAFSNVASVCGPSSSPSVLDD